MCGGVSCPWLALMPPPRCFPAARQAVLLRILAMFRAAKVSKPLLLTVCRPCLKLSRALPATSLAVWRLGGVGGSSTGLPGRGGLLKRGRSRPSCRWITRALSAGLSGSIFSTFLVVWMLGCVLGRLPLDVQGGGGLLGQGQAVAGSPGLSP